MMKSSWYVLWPPFGADELEARRSPVFCTRLQAHVGLFR